MTDPALLSRRLRRAAALIIAGLAVEAASLYSLKALSFIAFAGGGAFLVAAGVVLYLFAVVFH